MANSNEVAIVRRHMRSPPVDPKAIIQELGVRYSERDLSEQESGYIKRLKDGSYRITVNENEGLQRRRFTAAHELAHYLLHRDLLDEHGHLDRLYSGPDANEPYPLTPEHEVQANKLAAQILMPAKQVQARYDEGERAPGALARQFNVSEAAMRVRLKSLGLQS